MEGFAQLHLPVSIDESTFNKFVDSKLPDTIYADANAGGQGVDLLVLKEGAPTVILNGKTASVQLPLSIKAKRDLGFLKASADGELILTLNSLIDVKEDWELTTNTSVENIEWIKEPKLKMAGMSLSVKGMVENLITGNGAQVTQQIDDLIKQEAPLQKMITSVRQEFARAFPLDPDKTYYLQVIPESAGLATFQNQSGRIKSLARIEAKTILLYDSSEVRSEVADPVFDWADGKKSEYHLSTHLSFQDEEIESLMRDATKGQTFIFRKKRITMDQIFFDLQDEKIKADVHLSGGVKGKVHFEGMPYWDKSKSKLEFCDQQIDVDIQYGISKFLLWMFGSQIERVMSNKLEDAINDEIEARINEINSHLSDYKASDKVQVKASIVDHAIDPIYVTGRLLQLGINLKVEGKVYFEDLEINIE